MMELELIILKTVLIIITLVCVTALDFMLFQYIIAEPLENEPQISKKHRYTFGIIYCGLLYLTCLGMIFDTITR